jgi:phosphoribosyl-AMP cyclohydrolase
MTAINELEEGVTLALDFTKLARLPEGAGVIPCAVQDADSGEVILVAYVNEAALKAAVETRSAVFWSTSRNELWEKGKTSGETFDLLEIRVNCEQNSLIYRVRPKRGGPSAGLRAGICHTKNASGQPRNCYYRRLNFETWTLENLDP